MTIKTDLIKQKNVWVICCDSCTKTKQKLTCLVSECKIILNPVFWQNGDVLSLLMQKKVTNAVSLEGKCPLWFNHG